MGFSFVEEEMQKYFFQHILIDLICQGKGAGSHERSCQANGLGA
jgi:hypothetical protein